MSGRSRPATVLVDGKPTATIAADDRGLQYGDGLFETMRVADGGVTEWDRHMARLVRGCRRLGICPPAAGRLERERDRLCRGRDTGVLKLIITRGAGGRGYAPPDRARPRRVMSVHAAPEPAPEDYQDGVRVRVCETRLGLNPALAGIKHLNRLEQVMAQAERHDAGFAEGVMLDWTGRVIGGTMSNLFVVRGGDLETPALDAAGVAGTVRERILEYAGEAGWAVRIGELSLHDCLAADEVFLSNAVRGIRPVRELAGRAVPESATARILMQRLATPGFEPGADGPGAGRGA